MAEGRSRAAWEHTSSILAAIGNVFRGKNSRALKPSDMNPYTQKKIRVTKDTIGDIRAMLEGRIPAKKKKEPHHAGSNLGSS